MRVCTMLRWWKNCNSGGLDWLSWAGLHVWPCLFWVGSDRYFSFCLILARFDRVPLCLLVLRSPFLTSIFPFPLWRSTFGLHFRSHFSLVPKTQPELFVIPSKDRHLTDHFRSTCSSFFLFSVSLNNLVSYFFWINPPRSAHELFQIYLNKCFF